MRPPLGLPAESPNSSASALGIALTVQQPHPAKVEAAELFYRITLFTSNSECLPLWLDVVLAGDSGPFGSLCIENGGELSWGSSVCREAEACQSLLDIRPAEHVAHFGRNPFAQLRRHLLGTEHSEQAPREKAGKSRLRYGRNVGNSGTTLIVENSQQRYLPSLPQSDDGGKRQHGDVETALC